MVDFSNRSRDPNASVWEEAIAMGSHAIASGKQMVSDTADQVELWLPTREEVATAADSAIATASDLAGQAGEAISNAADKTVTVAKAVSSTPIKTLLDDIFLPNLGRKITADNFTPEAIETIRAIAQNKGLTPGETARVTYEDYNTVGSSMSVRFKSGQNQNQNMLESLANLSGADELKMTLGEATLSMDSEGNITLTDQYDFNSWVDFGAGAGPDGKYRELTSEEFAASDISFTEAVMNTVNNAPSDYQMMRNLAFLFGSRDYQDPSKDTGRTVEINLGKL